MISLVLFVFSVLFGQGETAAYNPTDLFSINCGGATSNTSDTTGRTWTPEQPEVLASNPVNASFTSIINSEVNIPVWKYSGSVSDQIYKTARIFRSEFIYSFPVSPGWKFLRLHFYPTRYGSDLDAVKFFFSVTVNGFTLLTNLTTNASESPYIMKEFIVPVRGGLKTLNLTFTPSPNSFAFVNAVEIVSMPDRFYTKGGLDDYITDVRSKRSDFKIDDTTALETVHRLYVGGETDPVVNDTGMFRQWLPDTEFSQNHDSFDPIFRSAMINYTKKTPAYVAPQLVYKSFRYFSPRWILPVDAGFNYLVRLHFCEFNSGFSKPRQRVFSIAIGNKIVQVETDVINNRNGGFMVPVYLDFKTDANKSGERPNLRLDFQPNLYAQALYQFGLSGIEILKLNDSKGNLAGSNKRTEGGKLHVLVIILIATGSAIGLASFTVVLMLSMRQTKRKNRKDNDVFRFKVLLKQYTYAELKKITKSFSHTLGKGGFGIVYLGNLSNGVKVAIKVMKDLKGTREDFINEVASMSQTSHVNIVSLLGFCYEGSKRAIVYEFLENGSLDQFISRANSSTLDVTTLYGIALGIARGLEYLHYGCKTRIVHFDIKPQNILLDENLCPKVSDFGLAKLCKKRESIVSLIDTRGTIGYIAPEVFSRTYGGVSHKSDVYSYGMLVLEMIGAKNKEIVENAASNAISAYFPDWIYKDLENGEQTWRFGDDITGEEKETVKKMIMVALWCIKPYPTYRPPMNKVVEMLEGSLDALEVPPKPSMRISTRFTAEFSSLSDSNNSSS